MQIFLRKFYRKTIESNRFVFAFFVVSAAFLISCSTDFQVNAPYKEENAIYGLLELHDNQQVIKIGKVFQNGSGVSASQAAKTMDSLYQSDSLYVTLTDVNTQTQTVLHKFYNTQKNAGYFASPGQYLYGTPPGFVLNPAGNYQLSVLDTKTKVLSQGSTVIVNDIVPARPYKGAQISVSNLTGLYSVSFGVGANAVTYDVNIYIYVKEYHKKDSSLAKIDTLVYNVLSAAPVSGASAMVQDFKNVDFYAFVGGSLKADPTIFRRMDSLDFVITGAGYDFANYIQVNTPSQGVVQKQPTYTDVTNGVGIFSSRLITHIKAPLTGASYALLGTSTYTQGLNFVP